MDALSRFVTPGLLFLLTLAAGLWLSRTGKPFNTAIFTIHKLLALGAVIFVAMQTNDELKLTYPHTIFSALLVLAAVGVVALFASGAMMSLNKAGQAMLLNIHKAAIVLAVIVGPLALLVLAGRLP
jgi:hypothetical protein